MHFCIAPEPGITLFWSAVRTVRYSIIIPNSDLFQSSTYLNSQGSIQCLLPLKVQSDTQTHSHHVLSGSHFDGWVNQLTHGSIALFAAPGASNLWCIVYETYALTNCAITARNANIHMIVK